jgi:outer membrane protein OmpA-like peptidoglycan-associated protein
MTLQERFWSRSAEFHKEKDMKNCLMVLLVSMALLGGVAKADPRPDRWGKAGVGAGAAAGALLAGPPGALLGAGFGGFFAERLARARVAGELESELAMNRSDLDELRASLQQARREASDLRADLSDRDTRIAELERARRSSLGIETEIMFRTGHSAIEPESDVRLDGLARMLEENPDLKIRLDGYADPRGESAANLELSGERVGSVREALTARGIAADRIESHAHGASRSEAATGDLDAYALERRVRVRLRAGDSDARVANSD